MTKPAVRPNLSYRIILASYPRRWHQNGKVDEILSVMLDTDLEHGRGRPTLTDAANVGLNGIRARLQILAAALPDPVRTRAAELALATGGWLALTLLTLGEVGIPGANPMVKNGEVRFPLDDLIGSLFGPFRTVGAVLYLGWIVLLIAAATGRAALIRRVAAICFAVTCLLPNLAAITHHLRPPMALLVPLAILNLAVLLLPNRPMPAPARWSIPAVAVASTLVVIAVRLLTLGDLGLASPENSGACFYWCGSDNTQGLPFGHGVAAVISHYAPVSLVVALLLALLLARRDRTWLAAVVLLSPAWLVLSARDRYWMWNWNNGHGLVTLLNARHWDGPTTTVTCSVIGLWLIAASTALLAVRALPSQRQISTDVSTPAVRWQPRQLKPTGLTDVSRQSRLGL